MMDHFLDELATVLGATPMRLARAILLNGTTPTTENPTITTRQDVVLAVLAAEEKTAPNDTTLRKRIELINTAAKSLADTYDGHPPFIVQTKAPNYVVTFHAAALSKIALEQARDIALAETRAATSAPAELMQEPQVLQRWQVFISHAWEGEAVEKKLAGFVEMLKHKLKYLPAKWEKRLGSIDVFFDDESMHGHGPFSDQAEVNCRASQLAIFMLNDKWHQSENCRAEARHFSKDDKPEPGRVICIQLTGERRDNPAVFKDYPIQPFRELKKFKNLIDLWSNGNAQHHEEFASQIRKDICEALEKQLPSPPESPVDPKEGKGRENPFSLSGIDKHVVGNQIEPPHALKSDERGAPTPLLPLLEEWATSKEAENRIFALLGSFGAGKTTAAQLFAQQLSQKYEDDPSRPFPVYLDFRRLLTSAGTLDGPLPGLPDIIRTCLSSGHAARIDAAQLVDLLRAEACVIIFDGLDEIGTRAGVERSAALFRQLLEIVPEAARLADWTKGKADWQASAIRILVTCRTHFFRDHVQQDSTLNGFDRADALPRKQKSALIRTLYMAPFTPEQIKSFFIKTVGAEDGEKIHRTISRSGDLKELAAKPIMTRYIAEIGPDLEDDVQVGRRINAARVYDHLFRRAMARDGEKQLQMTPADRQALLEQLAVQLWRSREPSMAIDALENWFDTFCESRPGLRMACQRRDGRVLLHTELRNASLLVREADDRFQFVHTSFAEYFLACALRQALLDDGFASLADGPEPSRETFGFLMDLIETRSEGQQLAAALSRMFLTQKQASLRQWGFALAVEAVMRDIAVSLPKGADLSGLKIEHVQLGLVVRRKVEGMNFTGTHFLGNHFNALHFDCCNFESANFSNCIFDDCGFVDCQGKPIGLASARARASRLTPEISFLKSNGLPFVLPQDYASGSSTIRHGLWRSRSVSCVAISPDGQHLATGSDNGTARLFSTATGAEVRRFEGHGGWVRSVAFSPDGQQLATGSDDGIARLFSAVTGAEVRRFEGHGRGAASVAFSPDGQHLVTGSSDGMARLFSTSTGAEVRRFEGRGRRVTSLAFSPDGQHLATGSHDRTAQLFSTATGVEVRRFEGHGGWVMSVAFSPDGQHLATGSHDGMARLFSTATGAEVRRFEGHGGWVRSVAFSPDGQQLATGSDDGIARLFSAVTGAEVRRFEGHGRSVTSVAFSPDGQHLATGSHDSTARLFSTSTGAEVRRFEGHGGWVMSVAFSPDGQHLATGSHDGMVRLFSTATGAEVRRFEGHGDWVRSVAFSPDGQHLATGSHDSTARLFSTSTGAEVRRFEGHGDWVRSVAFFPDGQHLATGSDDGKARLFSTATGAEVRRFEGHGDWVTSVAFSPDGQHLATGSDDGIAQLFSTSTGAEVQRFGGHGSGVTSVAFSPDGQQLATGSDDGTARLFSAATGAVVLRFEGHGRSVTSLAFSPDGERLALGCGAATFICDAATGTCLQRRHAGGRAWVVTDENDNVLRMNDHAWPHIYGLEEVPGGLPRLVAPRLPEIVADYSPSSSAALTALL